MGSVVAGVEWVGEAEVYVGVVAYGDGLWVWFACGGEECFAALPAVLYLASGAEFGEGSGLAWVVVYLAHMVSHAGSQHSAAASLDVYCDSHTGHSNRFGSA